MRLRTDGSSSEAVMNGEWVRRVVARGVDIAEVSRCGTLYIYWDEISLSGEMLIRVRT